MAAWTTDELERLGDAEELRIAGRRQDGGLRDLVIIWAVRVGDDVYVRSVRGAAGGWFKGVLVRHEGRIESGGAGGAGGAGGVGLVERDVVFEDVAATDAVHDRIDAAYADKYGAGSPDVLAITSDAARATTLRVVPKD